MPNRNGFIDFRAIKAAVSMESILAHYGLREKMRSQGPDSLTGCCPLHGGVNPSSFRVSISKNCWKCFSKCHTGGNVLDFVAKKEGTSIYEAAHLLADWFKVSVSDSPSVEMSRPKSKAITACEKVDAVSSTAAPIAPNETNDPNKPLAFTLKNLDASHPYLEERGLQPAVINAFGLGYCAKGLLGGRIAIPIHNADGELLAYAGRWPGQPPANVPKYQFPKGFRKAQEVFNLNRVRTTGLDGPLVIVEGFFDCIKLWQAGIERVVAIMGSEMSTEQESLIAEFVGKDGHVDLMFDPDEAGRAVRESVLGRLALRGYVRVIELCGLGRQPDELSTEQIHGLLMRDDIEEYRTSTTLFRCGRIVATPGALELLGDAQIRAALARHLRGDWGELSEEDRSANERALNDGSRLFSVYRSGSGLKFYVITESDRSVTTVLMPEDY